MPDKSFYTGEGRTKSGGMFERHGKGLAEWKEGLTYEGEWERDMQNGEGLESKKDGSLYQGQFFNGKKQGYGEYRWADASFYKGQWHND